MPLPKRLAVLILTAATMLSQTKAFATTMEEFSQKSPADQHSLYIKVTKIRMGQLREVNPQLADKMWDYFFKPSKPGKDDEPGYGEFKVYVKTVEHPELSGLKGYDPKKTVVEGILTQMIMDDAHKMAKAMAAANSPN